MKSINAHEDVERNMVSGSEGHGAPWILSFISKVWEGASEFHSLLPSQYLLAVSDLAVGDVSVTYSLEPITHVDSEKRAFLSCDLIDLNGPGT